MSGKEYISGVEMRATLHRLCHQGARFHAMLAEDFGYIHRDTVGHPRQFVAAILKDPEAVDELKARGWKYDPKP
jgi:hypothetical protein